MDTKNNTAIERDWAQQGQLVEKFLRKGLSLIPNLKKIFTLPNHDLGCIDEGVAEHVGIHDAGSGILRSSEEAEKDYKGKITGIWIHEGCGAAVLAFDALPDAEKTIYGNDVLRYAEYKVRKLAEKLEVPFKGTIPFSQMSRPPEFHNARAAYYDATGLFNPGSTPGLPKGFIISRRFVSDPAYAREQVALSFQIATGGHGYGNRISKDAPFFVFVLGDSRDRAFSGDAMQSELAPLQKDERVKIKNLHIPSDALAYA